MLANDIRMATDILLSLQETETVDHVKVRSCGLFERAAILVWITAALMEAHPLTEVGQHQA
jgi:hypothetical protein